MLCKKTIERIIKNSNVFGVFTVIGKYSYDFDSNTGYIYRCKTEDIGKLWIDCNGDKINSWKVITKV